MPKKTKPRNQIVLGMLLHQKGGKHHNRAYDTTKGRVRKPKHPKKEE